MAALHLGRGVVHTGLRGHIDLNEFDGKVPGSEIRHSLFTAFAVAGSHERMDAVGRELPGDLLSNSLVRARHERNISYRWHRNTPYLLFHHYLIARQAACPGSTHKEYDRREWLKSSFLVPAPRFPIWSMENAPSARRRPRNWRPSSRSPWTCFSNPATAKIYLLRITI